MFKSFFEEVSGMFKDIFSHDNRAKKLYMLNKEFCDSKGISIQQIVKDIKAGYLYPSQLNVKYSQMRIMFIHVKGGMDIVVHPDDKEVH